MGIGTASDDEIHLYVKAGVDGERLGACPFCQRVFMVLLIKAHQHILRFKTITVNPTKPPPEFKTLGLKHLPAIIHKEEGYDALDDIINYIDERFPGGELEYKNSDAELATKDFFSSFCFYIKAVSQDSTKLTAALEELNAYLERTFSSLHANTLQNGDVAYKDKQYLCGHHLSHLDCEVLPKLQHVRIASKVLKNYDIPINLRGLWRYLYTGYIEGIFTQTCPCDQEIILHWHDRPETNKLSHKKHAAIAKEKAKYSFDIPVHATVVTLTN